MVEQLLDARALAGGDGEDRLGDIQFIGSLEHRNSLGLVDAVDLVDGDHDRDASRP